MLLVCPSCRTRYVVPDSAIGMDGRQVRCANCKHSWFQGGAIPPVAPAPPVVAPAVIAPVVEEAAVVTSPPPPPTPPPPVAEPVDEPAQPSFARFDQERASEAVFVEPTVARTSYFEEPPPQSQFVHEPPFKPRRNPAKMWTMAAVAFAIVVAGVGGAIWYYGVPTMGMVGAEPDLKIVLNQNLELNERADGTPYFIASGSIVNPTGSTQTVPEMLVTLKDSGGRPVYSWKMKAKVRSLAPGAKVDFSEARLDVPLAATQISVGWVLNEG
jgi:predicted Zn finger-like uncharacterized protein